MAVTSKAKKPQKIYNFKWSGVNRKGKKVSGEIQGETANHVKAEMRRQGVNITKITKKSETLLDKVGDRVKASDIAVISRQIATMLTAGVPLVQSLQMIAKGNEKKSIRELIGSISTEVEGGTPLSDTLRKHPQFFDDLYCDLVEAGEQSGALETLFDRIAIYKEKAEALKSKIKKALFYPAMVVAVAIIVTTILLLFVIPQFEGIFEGFGAELPAFTQFVISISNMMQSYWYIVFGSLFIFAFFFKNLHTKNENVRNKTDIFILKLPVINTILHKAAMARFARTLSTTFAAGIPLIDALNSAAGASGNFVYRTAIEDIRTEVISGMQMNVAMRTTGVFPDMVTQMIMIGEESGDLDGMLNKVADIFEREVDDAVDALTSMLEPLIMVVLGVVVGGLVIAMYLPIFQLGSVVA